MKIKCSVLNGENGRDLVEGEVGVLVNDDTGMLELISPEGWGTYQRIYDKDNGMKGLINTPISPEGLAEMQRLQEEMSEKIEISDEMAEEIKKGDVTLQAAD